jgi:hypothetical protein
MPALRLSDGAGGVVALRLESAPLGSGGDGSIHASVSHPELVVKLYHDPDRVPERRRKLAAMLGTPPQLEPIHHGGHRYVQLTWPTHLVEDAEGRFLGFAMPRVEMDRAVLAETLLSRKTRKAYRLPDAYGLRVTAASNLAAVVEALHARGHHVVDLKPVNAYVYRDTFFVALLDCDGFSIQGASGERFPAHQYTPDYIAPEALAGQLVPEALGEAQDRFALAVVVFQLLNGGVHPFQGVPAPGVPVPPSTAERMARWMYAYGRRPNPFLRPSPWSLHESFDGATRDLFDRAFGEDPAARPDAGEWRRHLARYADPASGALRRCAADPAHAVFADGPSAACLQCALDARRSAAVQAARVRPVPVPAPVNPPAPRPASPAPAPAQRSSAGAWVIGSFVTAGLMAMLAALSNTPAPAPVRVGLGNASCSLAFLDNAPAALRPQIAGAAALSRGSDTSLWTFDASSRDAWGRSVLHWAVRMDVPRATEGAVLGGTPVDLPDIDGVTALMVASGRGDAWHVDVLLRNGASPNGVNAEGQTPLMYLAGSCKFARGETDTLPRGPEPALVRLVEAGANLDAQDRRGHTALMHATRGSGLRVRDLLLAGADPSRVDRAGRTALDIAASGPDSPDKAYIVEMLERVRNLPWSQMSREEREMELATAGGAPSHDQVDHPWRPTDFAPDSVFILPFRR